MSAALSLGPVLVFNTVPLSNRQSYLVACCAEASHGYPSFMLDVVATVGLKSKWVIPSKNKCCYVASHLPFFLWANLTRPTLGFGSPPRLGAEWMQPPPGQSETIAA